MSAGPLSAVVPPVVAETSVPGHGAVSRSREPLPLPALRSPRRSSVIYGAASIDDRGRVSDATVIRAMNWSAGLLVAITSTGATLTVHPDPAGACQLTGQGYVRIPAPLRHAYGLASGDRVVLAADPAHARLVIYPPATLDALLGGGEQA